MRGHQALLAMRRDGEKPNIVFIDTDAGPCALPVWAQWQVVDPRCAHIDMTASESLRRIDWRPCVGLVVHVSGTDSDRIRAVATSVEEAGAMRVISTCLRQIGKDEWVAFQTVWINDTAGHFVDGEACGSHAV